MKFYYMDGNRKKYITLKRAAPEWCNADCPTIFIEGPEYWHGWRLMTGLTLEDGNAKLLETARHFVRISGEEFYRKYPDCRTVPGRNGFLDNFEKGLNGRAI